MTQDAANTTAATMPEATRTPRQRRSAATPLADNELWFSARHASDLTDIAYRTFLDAVREGRIPSRSLVSRGRPLIHRNTIIALRDNKPCRGK